MATSALAARRHRQTTEQAYRVVAASGGGMRYNETAHSVDRLETTPSEREPIYELGDDYATALGVTVAVRVGDIDGDKRLNWALMYGLDGDWFAAETVNGVPVGGVVAANDIGSARFGSPFTAALAIKLWLTSPFDATRSVDGVATDITVTLATQYA
jgi:hypothetical protein